MPAVLAEGLKKRFGKTEALCGVDFDVKRGTVLCVLGPNGAGKTTTVRILTTLLKPDAGRAMIDGIDVVAEPRRARARIGLTGQYAAVDERLTGRENLEHVARLFHLPGSEARQRAAELLERFNLQNADGRVVKGYSGGMRRRLDIAMSLIARPSVLFLDEPTTGLDPRSRLAMWDLIDELVREGMSTLLTTQYLEEAERLADEIVVIDHGRVIARGTSSQLKAHAGGERVEVRVAEASDLERVGPLLRTAVEITAPERIDSQARTVLLPVRDGDDLVPRIVRLLDGAGVSVKDVVVHRPTLDDVFLQLTGHAADEGEDGPGPAGAPASSNGLASGKTTKNDPGGRG